MGEQLTTATIERRSHALPALNAEHQIASQGQHLLGGAGRDDSSNG
jgi:hypothetical protein